MNEAIDIKSGTLYQLRNYEKYTKYQKMRKRLNY